jgi:NAD-dependent deacetylase
MMPDGLIRESGFFGDLEAKITLAAEVLGRARSIMVLSGAGVSAESGVPTFRDAQTGLWAQYDPDRLASPEGFAADPGLVWRWYMERLHGAAQAQPNAGHRALVSLQQRIPLVLYTQNVDDLHERAGSLEVRHLHGSLFRHRCHRCRAPYDLTPADRQGELPPRCSQCRGFIRPDVVWFGEMLPAEMLQRAWEDARNIELMLVVGTSGLVQPVAHLPGVARAAGRTVIDVNPEPGPISRTADLYLQGSSGRILPRIVASMKESDAGAR